MTHAPEEVEEVGPLELFNGEALEKLNDEFKKNHLRQTNCKDICVTLRVQKRQELARRNQAIRAKERNARRGTIAGREVMKCDS